MAHPSVHHSTFAGQAASALNRTAPPNQHEQILTQAQKWVAQTFYGTLLKQVRNSPFHSQLFEGGRGGEAFGALYDQQLADHMARGSGKKLANAIASRIEANKAYRHIAKTSRNRTPDAKTLSTHWRSHVPAGLRA
ncbi:MAG TPA: rod-binding protein [Tepidisphaeraceae bacterium]|nr:rod-binding protein [Tepidisphaeraceae bacterium]